MKKYLLILFLLAFIMEQGVSQRKRKTSSQNSTVTIDSKLYQELNWRNIGPFRGGRSTASTGVTTKPLTYYFGSTGGGVWKTTNAGGSWSNVSDGYFKSGSVGAIAVSESDPNVIYVGMGEAPIRGVMTSSGDGVYKSVDGGNTWKHLGLQNTLHISKIRIHPDNPDLVYVAAQGNPYKENPERGIYRSKDGGLNWEKVLHVDAKSGASDLSMDPTNPRFLYAAFWEHQRTPWQVISGGPGSGLYKSADGGDTWERMEKGLPEDVMGKIGISVSPANPSRIWAIIEAEKGGLYRSDDRGESWKLINSKRILRTRSWYYMHIFADPKNENIVYVLNAPFMKSIDGGKTFANVSVPHGDNHDLWINPENPEIMINSNDGGANISFNGGVTWTDQSNQPTAQFYRVNTDNQFPYWIYGGQQDNSSVGIPSRSFGSGIGRTDWIAGVGGCESAYTAFDPDNPQYIYAGCYQGIIDEWDRETRSTRDIMAYPVQGLGSNSKNARYRFNWNAPILVSQHDSKTIFHAGNKLLKSTNRGRAWTEISPDLTRNDTTKQGWGGSPITNEGAGGEVYGAIMYIAESPHAAGEIWAGSDDGLIHITKDGGSNWANITPAGMSEMMVNSIEVSPHTPGTAYASVTGYKLGNFSPYIFKTTDYGQNWKKMVSGILANHFVRVVREDPGRKDLLYAGTEYGLSLSFDGGESWNSFQQNLPIVPITDLKVTHNDLVAATQGRAFWVLDDLTPLHTLSVNQEGPHIFKPDPVVLTSGFRNPNANKQGLGMNPYNGVELRYLMNSDSEEDTVEFKIEFLDAQGSVLRSFSPQNEDNKDTLSFKPGMNVVRWDFRTKPLETPKDLFTFGNTSGHRIMPGTYTAKLTYEESTIEQSFTVVVDPRYQVSASDQQKKQEMIEALDETLTDLYTSVIELYSIRKQVESFNTRFEDIEDADIDADNPNQEFIDMGDKLLEKIKDLESRLVQPKQKTFQDVINFPNQLDANILHLRGIVDGNYPPMTNGENERFEELQNQWASMKAEIETFIDEDLKAYNDQLSTNKVSHIAPVRKQ